MSYFEININTSFTEVVFKIITYIILLLVAYFIIYFGLIYCQRCTRKLYVKIWRYIYPQYSATIVPLECAKETDEQTNSIAVEVVVIDAHVHRPYNY